MPHPWSWSSVQGPEPTSGIYPVAQGLLPSNQTNICIRCYSARQIDSESTWTFVALLESNWVFRHNQ